MSAWKNRKPTKMIANSGMFCQRLVPSIFLRPFSKKMTTEPIEYVNVSNKLSQVRDLNAPPLDELLPILSHGIQKDFAETSVEIVECPDLSGEPFNLTGRGIGSDLCIAEVGGQGNLFPKVRREKTFNLKTVANTCGFSDCFVFGPGAGSRQVVGVNSEMTADAVFGPGSTDSKINTHICKIVRDSYKQEEIQDPRFGLMANLGVCSNQASGPVLKIAARKRTGNKTFPEAIRSALLRHYGAKLVSFCGIFLVEKGQVVVHVSGDEFKGGFLLVLSCLMSSSAFQVMPDFPDKDFYSRDQLQDEWLKFFEVKAPLVCASVLHSTDPHLDLRFDHTHAFSKHGDAGHYHYDTTPDTIQYTGYFRPAEKLYRIDQIDVHGREVHLV